MSDELKDILQHGGDKSDVAIEKALKSEGNDYFVKIEKSGYDGKVEVVKLANDDGYKSDDSGPVDVDASRITRLRRTIALKKWQRN
jgi:hypothetical protein